MQNMQPTPEWQAMKDWRDEGVFRPETFSGTDAERYRCEAKRIERDWHGQGGFYEDDY